MAEHPAHRELHELHAPPMLRVEELAWRREPEGLVVERRPGARGIAVSLGMVVVFGGFAWFNAQRGNLGAAAFLVFVAFLGLVALLVSLTLRVRIVAGSAGLAWERRGPRAGQGHWPRGALSGARVVLGPRPTRWGFHQVSTLELHVRGGWTPLAWGHDRARAEALAAELRGAMGMPEEPSSPPGAAGSA